MKMIQKCKKCQDIIIEDGIEDLYKLTSGYCDNCRPPKKVINIDAVINEINEKFSKKVLNEIDKKFGKNK